MQFQLIYDFLDTGIGVKKGDEYRYLCESLSPLPKVALFKEYGDQETIEILENGNWKLFGKKEVPLITEEKGSNTAKVLVS